MVQHFDGMQYPIFTGQLVRAMLRSDYPFTQHISIEWNLLLNCHKKPKNSNQQLFGILYEVKKKEHLMCNPHFSIQDLLSVTKTPVSFPQNSIYGFYKEIFTEVCVCLTNSSSVTVIFYVMTHIYACIWVKFCVMQ